MDTSASQLNTDLSAIIAQMPDALSLLNNTIATTKSSALSTGDIPLLMTADQMHTMSTLSLMILQQQQMQMMGMNPFVFGSLPTGIQSIPGLDALTLANLTRPHSQSAVSSPKQSSASDMRPRAFSSAATLQPSMLPGERRRKRSHHDEFVPPQKTNSILRGLVESDEEPIQIQLAPPKSEDDRLKADISQVLARAKPPSSPAGSYRLRPLIRDEDLPETVGPDSPFRHHPKYLKKSFGLSRENDDTDAVAFVVASGMWAPPTHSGASSDANSSAGNSPKYGQNENSPKSFHDILDQTLARELVAAE